MATYREKLRVVRRKIKEAPSIYGLAKEAGRNYQTLADIRDDKPGKTTQEAVINGLYDYFKS